jgi:hypothetical protein
LGTLDFGSVCVIDRPVVLLLVSNSAAAFALRFHSCVTCGGTDCDTRDGGYANCCSQDVLALKKPCSATQGAPCTASAAAAPAPAPSGTSGGDTTPSGTCPGAVGGEAGVLNAEGVSALLSLYLHFVSSQRALEAATTMRCFWRRSNALCLASYRMFI